MGQAEEGGPMMAALFRENVLFCALCAMAALAVGLSLLSILA